MSTHYSVPDDEASTCIVCGKPFLVEHRGGREDLPIAQAMCEDCLEQRLSEAPEAIPPRGFRRSSLPGLLMWAGGGLGFLGLAADHLGLGGHRGFGWHQQLGALVGLMFVVVGAMFRADLLGILGTVLFPLALCIDYLGIGSSPGIGPKQQFVIGIAVVLLLAGFIARRRSRKTPE